MSQPLPKFPLSSALTPRQLERLHAQVPAGAIRRSDSRLLSRTNSRASRCPLVAAPTSCAVADAVAVAGRAGRTAVAAASGCGDASSLRRRQHIIASDPTLASTKEELVQCQRCGRLRRYPAYIDRAQLPDPWFCEYDVWDKHECCCDESEVRARWECHLGAARQRGEGGLAEGQAGDAGHLGRREHEDGGEARQLTRRTTSLFPRR